MAKRRKKFELPLDYEDRLEAGEEIPQLDALLTTGDLAKVALAVADAQARAEQDKAKRAFDREWVKLHRLGHSFGISPTDTAAMNRLKIAYSTAQYLATDAEEMIKQHLASVALDLNSEGRPGLVVDWICGERYVQP